MQPKNPKVAFINEARSNAQREPTARIYQFGGRPAPEDMVPAKYPVVCTDARIRKKGNKTNIVLMHEVSAGKMSGVELLQWLALPDNGKKISHRTDIWKHFALVLGRPPSPNEFNEQVFVGKTFLAYVGFTQKDPETGRSDMIHTERKKGDRDFLRVHTLLEVLP